MQTTDRFRFQLKQISDVYGPDLIVRTYLEHKTLRSLLAELPPLNKACEVGCGYGRMTAVLTEFATTVIGFEREPEFIDIAKRLLPQIQFHQVASLATLPAQANDFDLILTFTCLQHHSPEEILPTLKEITRITKENGYLLLCEETSPYFNDNFKTGEFGTIGRPVSTYQNLLPEFSLIKTEKRPPEPSYPRSDVGTFMLFQKKKI